MGLKRQMPATWLAKQRARWNRGGEGAAPTKQEAKHAAEKKGSVARKPGEVTIDKARARALKQIIALRQAKVKNYLTSETNDKGIDLKGESKDRIRPNRSRATGARSIRNQDNSITARSLAIGVGARQKYAANMGTPKKGQQFVKNDTGRNVHSLAFKSLKSKKKKK